MKKSMKLNSLKTLGLATGVLAHAFGAAAQPNSIEAICAQPDIECSFDDAGVIVGSPGSTQFYAGGVKQAAQKFEHYFGEVAPQAAVVLGEVLDTDVRRQLRQSYPVVLPWLTLRDREDMIARGVRRQIQRARPDLEGEALEAVVKRSVEASLSASGNSGDEDLHSGVFAHELGHLFFIETYWPSDDLDVLETNPAAVTRYAGPGPDWLDEMAAVLMENDALTNGREEGLVTANAADDGLQALWPLDEFFTMTHPAFEQARRLIEARQNSAEGRARGGVVMLSSGELEAREDGRSPATFYAQSRGFADYMIEKSGDSRLFASIAAYIAAGGDMAGWLADHGQAAGVPDTIKTLDADFKAWLMDKYDDQLPSGEGHAH